MLVKHNHTCSMCSQSKTCFIFDEFSMLFSICRSCYDNIVENILLYRDGTDYCSFCERELPVKLITGFDDSLFFSKLFICSNCFQRLQEFVDIKPQTPHEDDDA